MNLAPEFVVADRFRLISLIGQGGMGAVWLAHHLSLDVRCAVKFIHPEVARSPGLLARFEREAKAIAQIQGRHVVKVYDRGVWNDVPYIAMEFLAGEDLDRRLRRVGHLTPFATFTILSDIGRALSKAHALGLVHRDLKPGNIFLFQDDDREIAKVLDFGIAKDTTVAPDAATKAGALLGTPYYMSPEQWRADGTVDARADLWSLGVIAYQCLTGVLPFNGQALGDLFMKVLVEPIPVPSQVAPVPPGFDAWWAHAMQREPARRFQTTKEAIHALGTALGVNPSLLDDPQTAGGPPSGGLPPLGPLPGIDASLPSGRPPEDLATIVLDPGNTSANAHPPLARPTDDQAIPGVPKQAPWVAIVLGALLAVGVLAVIATTSIGPRAKAPPPPSRSASTSAALLSTAAATTTSQVSVPLPPASAEPVILPSPAPSATPAPTTRSVPGPLPTARRVVPAKTDRAPAPTHGAEGMF